MPSVPNDDETDRDIESNLADSDAVATIGSSSPRDSDILDSDVTEWHDASPPRVLGDDIVVYGVRLEWQSRGGLHAHMIGVLWTSRGDVVFVTIPIPCNGEVHQRQPPYVNGEHSNYQGTRG